MIREVRSTLIPISKPNLGEGRTAYVQLNPTAQGAAIAAPQTRLGQRRQGFIPDYQWPHLRPGVRIELFRSEGRHSFRLAPSHPTALGMV